MHSFAWICFTERQVKEDEAGVEAEHVQLKSSCCAEPMGTGLKAQQVALFS